MFKFMLTKLRILNRRSSLKPILIKHLKKMQINQKKPSKTKNKIQKICQAKKNKESKMVKTNNILKNQSFNYRNQV